MAQKDLPFLLDSLYCEEEQHWEEEDEGRNYKNIVTPHPKQLLEQDMLWEEEELSSLLSKEQENQSPMYEALERNPSLAGARNDAVEWILKVNAYFSFSALTAVLAVNYFDRFFSRFHFQREKPWMSQLAAVACLSLAAKVEETQVPLLLDLQVEETRYVFEAKTIQRMEILVLSTLQWRMNPVTPLSFVDYILRRLGLMNHPCWEFLFRCESLILCIISDFRFTNYLPSVLATAIMLHVINTVEPCLAVDYHNQILATLGIDKDKVEECYKQIVKSTSELCYQARKRKLRSIPGSPNGVMDACFSSDSSNDSWAAVASVSSSPEQLSKRSKGAPDHQHC
ncbi:cyclin-D3-3-like [Rhododendron vialii]|uniref:cyclin-D3-3-like n=1 Tax=Rhododendron vialii TaxID=182163 RepID=UPI00265D9F79|nr:cyclin-D3-3-like [Rhododendron vialii]